MKASEIAIDDTWNTRRWGTRCILMKGTASRSWAS